MNIVIVDDDPVSLCVMSEIVAKLPQCTVTAFCNPTAALDRCLENPPDLVIVDYMMPGLDGVAFSRVLRMSQPTHAVPIVMVSAAIDRGILKGALQQGVDEFLHKPFTFVALQACVSELLGLRAMQGQLANKQLLLTAHESDREEHSRNSGVLGRHVSRARLAGDEALLARVAELVLHHTPDVLSRIRQSLLDADFEAVVRDVVLLKGAVTCIEAPQLSRCLDNLELQARSFNAGGARAAFAFAQALAERLLSELAPLVVHGRRTESADGPATEGSFVLKPLQHEQPVTYAEEQDSEMR
jgi:CheY-like chemotaxis protein/HPt (histidine-containing phosphotransfer) domain-containing protein